MTVLVGADPEFFVKEDGKHISAYGLIEGTKSNPTPVKDGAVQVDGMALEFNINPAETFEEFHNNIASVVAQMHELVPGKEFDFSPVASFTKEYMDEQPEDAKKLGCDPDFNAYTGKPNNPPNGEALFRTASGHIHIGWTDNQDVSDPEHIEACQMLVKQLDVVLGLASVVWDPDTKRRELYGKAGAYRPKPYGVEYRVMSNTWVLNPLLQKFIFQGVQYAFDSLVDGEQFYKNFSSGSITDFINNSNRDYCYEYSRQYARNFGCADILADVVIGGEKPKAKRAKKPQYDINQWAPANAPWPAPPIAPVLQGADIGIIDDFDENAWFGEEGNPGLL